MFRNKVPHGVGGGTVAFVTRESHHYRSHIEEREEGGTPGIIESIRAGLVFKLKNALGANFILERETALFRLAAESWSVNPRLVILGSLQPERLPIFPLLFYNEHTGRFVHHDFIALILNDMFGIQVRSGCACAAPYGMDLLGINDTIMRRLRKLIITSSDEDPNAPLYTESDFEDVAEDHGHEEGNVDDSDFNVNKPKDSPMYEGSSPATNLIFKPGFVRLNFPYFISEECFDFVVKAIELVADKGWSLLPLTKFHRKKSLKDITFSQGRFDIKTYPKLNTGPPKIGDKTIKETPSPSHSLPSIDNVPNFNYQPGKFIVPDQTGEFYGEADKLRWFMLPSEASNIVNSKKVYQCYRNELALNPGRTPVEKIEENLTHEWWWIKHETPIILGILAFILFVIICLILLIWTFFGSDTDADETGTSTAGNSTNP
ncbi:tRNA 2-thiocytidine biosynthesis protein ttca [Plakobranchus ocellatus]|uniref:tRNA 2-thiocytidine biosynthesis protein ttca n=1 Tax=Plakobranchus ocellatus TaxID=259542 RepID=A0AAV4B8J5_9GAST|nr:tRNA 2-thiocytidine biosynthesis protein ttca [Plakobranchus ocellatus]